jgi:hypothetical protein
MLRAEATWKQSCHTTRDRRHTKEKNSILNNLIASDEIQWQNYRNREKNSESNSDLN